MTRYELELCVSVGIDEFEHVLAGGGLLLSLFLLSILFVRPGVDSTGA